MLTPTTLTAAVLAALAATPAFAVTSPPITLRAEAIELTLLVPNDDQALDQLVADASRLGGYFKERSAHHLVARVPTTAIDDYVKNAINLGSVVERRVTTKDGSEERAALVAGIASREEMLARYLANLSDTKNHEDLAAIQTASNELIADIEHAKGQLNVLNQQGEYAEVDISLRLRERAPLHITHEPHFAWLNTVGLEPLLADFGAAVEEK